MPQQPSRAAERTDGEDESKNSRGRDNRTLLILVRLNRLKKLFNLD